MKIRVLLAFIFLPVILASFIFIQKATTVYIIGDSTAANKQPEAYPETGWGMALNHFLNRVYWSITGH